MSNPNHTLRTSRRVGPAAAGVLAALLLVAMASAAMASTVYLKVRYGTLRAAMGSRAAKVARVVRGTPMEVVAEHGGFIEVKLEDGRQGFISRSFVADTLPKVDQRMARLGRAARDASGGGVTVTAGARGLSPEAKAWTDRKPNMLEAAEAVERMEQRLPPLDAIDLFMEQGGLGPWRGQPAQLALTPPEEAATPPAPARKTP